MAKLSFTPARRTLLLVIALEVWVIGIALYALLREQVVPTLDFWLLLAGSILLPIVLYFVLRKRDTMRAKNRANSTNSQNQKPL